MADLLSVPTEQLSSGSSAALPSFRRVGSNESRKSDTSSASPNEGASRSFVDINTFGMESMISLTTADVEKRICTQVSWVKLSYVDSSYNNTNFEDGA